MRRPHALPTRPHGVPHAPRMPWAREPIFPARSERPEPLRSSELRGRRARRTGTATRRRREEGTADVPEHGTCVRTGPGVVQVRRQVTCGAWPSVVRGSPRVSGCRGTWDGRGVIVQRLCFVPKQGPMADVVVSLRSSLVIFGRRPRLAPARRRPPRRPQEPHLRRIRGRSASSP